MKRVILITAAALALALILGLQCVELIDANQENTIRFYMPETHND